MYDAHLLDQIRNAAQKGFNPRMGGLLEGDGEFTKNGSRASRAELPTRTIGGDMLDEKTRAHIEDCRQEMEEHLARELNTYKFSDAQIEDIAERAATKALAKITDMAYREVGKSIISKLFYITGVLAVAAYLYAQSHGWMK